MQTTNFLPGMNPYLQARWPDAHTALIGYIREVLSARLPVDLAVVAEESISIDFDDGSDLQMRTDIAVIERPSLRFPDPVLMKQDTSTLTLAEPETVRVSPTQRWLEIRDVDNHLVTIIELLSPSNKTLHSSVSMSIRHDQLIRSGVNVVEIDLIRGGIRALPDMLTTELREPPSKTTYLIVVGKAGCVDERQVYYCPLRQRLPAFAIPLRSTDSPVPLDLQPLVDRCYQTGRYWQLSQRPLPPPALPADEQAWVDQHRIAAGLIDASV